MKLCFSTKGWHGVLWQDFVKTAHALGFSGIELHNLHDPVFARTGSPRDPYAAGQIKHDLFCKGLEIPCIDSITDLLDDTSAEEKCEEISVCLRTAADLSVPYVRVRAYDHPGAPQAQDDAVLYLLQRLLPVAQAANCELLLETAGPYADTARLRRLLDRLACDGIGVLWDLYAPCMEKAEPPQQTVTNLGAFVRHVHIRDFAPESGTFCLMGEGAVPTQTLIGALESINYAGHICFEWDPTWLPEAADMHLVFAHFRSYMSRYEKKAVQEIYYNKLHTGRRIWPKEVLIRETFPQVLDRVAEEFPDQIAFKYTTLDYTRTYAQFRRDVDTFARALVALGVKSGTKVAVWATNVPAWYIAFWATVKIGAVLVTVNTAYKIHEAEYLLRQSDTHTLILVERCQDSDYAEIIRTLCPELIGKPARDVLHAERLPFLRRIITVGFQMEGCLRFEDAMALADSVSEERIRRLAAAVQPEDVCNMQYTSGTTGFPKGVMLTHHGVVNNGKCIGDRMDLSTADRMLIQVPMFHCFGMVLAMTAAMTHGATLCPLPYFSAKNALACINAEHITVFHGVPTMFIAMFNHPDYKKTDFSYMRTGIMAGSGCPADLMRRAAQPDEMNMRGIVSVYGQTEAAPGCTMSELDDPLDERCETVGHALPHVECRIIDPQTGAECAVGENGEFVARGYNVMKGYYKMPDATAAAIDADGWLHTGDLACKTPQGNYKITGRLKDMIIRGGENIYPKEIEEFIYTCPKVRDVQVVGVSDRQYGEEICACVILKKGEQMTQEELQSFVRSHMARHKVPRYVDFMDTFPMNAAGKILKYKLREQAEQRHCQND